MIRIFYIAVLVLASLARWGQSGMLLAVPADGEAEISTLLDDYPGAIAAYSTAKLSSTATNCVTIKRSSDGDTLVVGFSGNDFDGSNDYLTHNLNSDSVATAFSFWGVLDTDDAQTGFKGVYATTAVGSGAGFMVLKRGGDTSNWGTFSSIYYPSGTDINPSASSTLISMISSDGNSGTFYTDATSDGTFAATRGQVGRHIGGEEPSAQNVEMQCQLILVYPTDESSNRTSIETIINNYFSIY